jgi:prevent-host-death family protein
MSVPAEVSVRDLRNHASEVLRRVEAGEHLRVTVDRRPVADLVPLPRKRLALPFAELRAFWRRGKGADPALLRELAEAVPGTTDDI